MGARLAGKIIAVTGASTGIGKETARALAAMGAEIILVVRSKERGEAAIKDLAGSVHGAKLELVLAERIRRIVSERRKVLWAFDQEDWARHLEYAAMPLELSRDLYAAARAGTRHVVAEHYETLGHREWDHSEMGVRTLKMEMDKVAEHNEHHLGQIRAALKQFSDSARK